MLWAVAFALLYRPSAPVCPAELQRTLVRGGTARSELAGRTACLRWEGLRKPQTHVTFTVSISLCRKVYTNQMCVIPTKIQVHQWKLHL